MKRFKKQPWHTLSLYRPNNWELLNAEEMTGLKRAVYLWNPVSIARRVHSGLWERRNVTECPY